jgi:macrolide-specific efflux system membrane fusion protein
MWRWGIALGLVGLAVGLGVAGLVPVPVLLAAGEDRVETPDAADPSKVHDCLITPLRMVDVPADLPATEGGVLMAIKVREGEEVKAGDLLAQIDDRQAKAAKTAAHHRMLGAKKEADNEISVRYSQAKNLVAKAAYDKGVDANFRVPGTTPELELQKLKLEVVASALEIEHSQYQLQIAAINVDVRQAELDLANLDVVRRQIKAPISGVVVKRHREEGEWVRSGDPIVQLLEMDRLRIEAFLDGTQLAPADVFKRPVSVTVTLPHGQKAERPGEITYVSPMMEAGARFLVKAEVVNDRQGGHWLLGPGMKAEMTIQLKK